MRAPEALSGYVRDALARGHDRSSIAAAARSAGWSGAETDAALEAWVDAGPLPPVPRPRTVVSARDALRHGVAFLTLLIIAFNLVDLGFALIDSWLQDPLAPATRSAGAIRWSVAALIVAGPVWAWLTLATARETDRDLGQRRSAVESWLTSAALFLAAATLIGTGTANIAGFLGGDLTASFVLKSLWAAMVSGMVFAFHRTSAVAPGTTPRAALPRARAMVGLVAAAGTVIALLGLSVAGGPEANRRERRDQARIAALHEIAEAVACTAAAPGSFAAPASAADIPPACLAPDRARALADPLTGAAHAITYPAPGTVRVCASLEAPAADAESGCVTAPLRTRPR